MLPAAHRLRRRSDFVHVARSGRRAARRLVVVQLAPAPAAAAARPVRVGFIVDRRLGGAVSRNRVRRRLRELVADRLDRFEGAQPGASIVVRATPAAAGAPSRALAAALDAALHDILTGPHPERRSRERAAR